MTLLELAERVYGGAFIIAGELRGCDVQESGYVDKKTGIAEKTPLLTYFIECTGTLGPFSLTKVTGRFLLDCWTTGQQIWFRGPYCRPWSACLELWEWPSPWPAQL